MAEPADDFKERVRRQIAERQAQQNARPAPYTEGPAAGTHAAETGAAWEAPLEPGERLSRRLQNLAPEMAQTIVRLLGSLTPEQQQALIIGSLASGQGPEGAHQIIQETAKAPDELAAAIPVQPVPPPQGATDTAIDIGTAIVPDVAMGLMAGPATVARGLANQAGRQGIGALAREGLTAGGRQALGAATEASLGEAAGRTAEAVGGPAAGLVANVATQGGVGAARGARDLRRAGAQERILRTDQPLIEGYGEGAPVGAATDRLRLEDRPGLALSRSGRTIQSEVATPPTYRGSDVESSQRNVTAVEQDLQRRADELSTRGPILDKEGNRVHPVDANARAAIESRIEQRKASAQEKIKLIDDDPFLQSPNGVGTNNTVEAIKEGELQQGRIPTETDAEGNLLSPQLSTEGSKQPIGAMAQILSDPTVRNIIRERRRFTAAFPSGPPKDLIKGIGIDADDVPQVYDWVQFGDAPNFSQEAADNLISKGFAVRSQDGRLVPTKRLAGKMRPLISAATPAEALAGGETFVESMSAKQLQNLRSHLMDMKRGLGDDPTGKSRAIDKLVVGITKDLREAAEMHGPEYLAQFDAFNEEWKSLEKFKESRIVRSILSREGDAISPLLAKSTTPDEIRALRDELGGQGSPHWSFVQASLLNEMLDPGVSEGMVEASKRIGRLEKIPRSKFEAVFDTGDPKDLVALRQNVALLRSERRFLKASASAPQFSIRNAQVWFDHWNSLVGFYRTKGSARALMRIANTRNPQHQAQLIQDLRDDMRQLGIGIRIGVTESRKENERRGTGKPTLRQSLMGKSEQANNPGIADDIGAMSGMAEEAMRRKIPQAGGQR